MSFNSRINKFIDGSIKKFDRNDPILKSRRDVMSWFFLGSFAHCPLKFVKAPSTLELLRIFGKIQKKDFPKVIILDLLQEIHSIK